MRHYAYACVVAVYVLILAYLLLVPKADAYPGSNDKTLINYTQEIGGYVPIDSLDAWLITAPCPGSWTVTPNGCWTKWDKTAYISDSTEETTAHELGHVFDDQLLNTGIRNKIMRVMELDTSKQSWYPPDGVNPIGYCDRDHPCPNEWFAEMFMGCALGYPTERDDSAVGWGGYTTLGGYEARWKPHIKKDVCRIINKVGAAADR